jgi:hypothetical protein
MVNGGYIVVGMPHNDPRLPLRCPKCGEALRYGASTSSGGAYRPGDVFQTDADIHHYACTGPFCRTYWKFGPSTPLLEDPLRLADGPQQAH